MSEMLRAIWRVLRAFSGDDAYERYLRHQQALHPGEPCLGRQAFYLDDQRRRWSGGVQRCC
jgi:uncharacterized short protein YbdD (DUF466 family)